MREMKKGDILHVKLGCADVGDGMSWVPTEDEMTEAHEMWTELVPEGVTVVVTHFATEVEVVPVEDEDAKERPVTETIGYDMSGLYTVLDDIRLERPPDHVPAVLPTDQVDLNGDPISPRQQIDQVHAFMRDHTPAAPRNLLQVHKEQEDRTQFGNYGMRGTDVSE